MHADLLVINARQLVTCNSGGIPKRGGEMLEAGLIENGGAAIIDAKFAAVGPSSELEAAYSADKVIDAKGQVVVPGLVDPHTHVVYAGDRLEDFELKIQGAEYLEILAAGGGILSTVRETRAAGFEDLVSASRRRLDKMLECGTTTCEIKSGYGLEMETELKMLRAIEELDRLHPIEIVPAFLAAHTVPEEFKGDADGYVEEICERMLPRVSEWYSTSHFARSHRQLFVDVFCERNAFDTAQMRRIFKAAREERLGLKAHVDQFTNLGGSLLAIEFGAVSIDHLDAISDAEIARLAESSTIGVVIPTENFSAAKPNFADARKMIDAGCAVSISTDYNPGSAPCPSLPMAMAIACRYQKMRPVEALNACTINAAFAVGLGKSHGSIETGKAADLAIFDVKDHRELAYEFGCMRAAKVIKSGSVVFGEV
jgi:imidazolonepropionase